MFLNIKYSLIIILLLFNIFNHSFHFIFLLYFLIRFHQIQIKFLHSRFLIYDLRLELVQKNFIFIEDFIEGLFFNSIMLQSVHCGYPCFRPLFNFYLCQLSIMKKDYLSPLNHKEL
jgi:hypothetical protein